MAQIWFVQHNDQIDGPMTSDEVESRLQTGQFNSASLIWGRGMEHWRTISWWNSESQGSSVVAEHTVTQIVREAWHYAFGGESHGPFQREVLVEKLKALGSLGDVLLWTKGMKEWAPIFEFHDILSAMGVNKRQYPRADITGQVTIKTNTGQTLVAPLLTISEGGLGVQLEVEGLTAGMPVSVEVASTSFRSILHLRADVRYVADGVTGLKFSHVSPEARGAIISFVRQSQTRFVLKAS